MGLVPFTFRIEFFSNYANSLCYKLNKTRDMDQNCLKCRPFKISFFFKISITRAHYSSLRTGISYSSLCFCGRYYVQMTKKVDSNDGTDGMLKINCSVSVGNET